MSKYQLGKIEIDPKTNPAILDNLTWDEKKAADEITGNDIKIDTGGRLNGSERFKVHHNSHASFCGEDYYIGELEDGQHVILRSGNGNNTELGTAIKEIRSNGNIRIYPLSAENLHFFVTQINPRKGPKALGAIPRIGIGVRHSSCIWPGIWNAMNRGDFSANAIQNSVRELHLLDTLKSGSTPANNYLFSFGAVPEGHAGSTFEGLWSYGVLSALKSPHYPRYGADADHLQIKRGQEGLERTKAFIRASRYYSFYTIDVSDILDYWALKEFSAGISAAYIDELIAEKGLKKDILAYHRQKRVIGKTVYEFDEAETGRFIAKYWNALNAIEELNTYIKELKAGEPFDLELSIDENPPEIATFDAITSNRELLFLVEEIKRRNLPISHIAPNFGVEKCTDYRGPDGLEMLQRRVREQSWIASENGMMLDCHSGDDLSRQTRRIFGSAARGRIHFKISPSLQILYAQTLNDMDKSFFDFWWNDTLEFTKSCAESGSSFARKVLALHDREESKEPSPDHLFFKEFNFASLGKRDSNGQFINRDRFYSVSDEFLDDLTGRLETHLCLLAEDLFNH